MREMTLTVALRTNNRYFTKVYDDRPFLLHEPLFRWGARRKGWMHTQCAISDLEPRLAESYEVSLDGLVYTVHLRKGVKSVFGNELTADDVKWSWDRALGTRSVGTFTVKVAPMRKPDNIVVKDKYTVEFHLDKPNVTFPHTMASKYLPILDSTVVKQHVTEEDKWAVEWLKENHAAFGPFYVEKYDKEADIVIYGRNKDYWYTGTPIIDKLVLRGIPSPSERLRMLKAGEVDVAISLAADDFQSLEGDPDIDRDIVPSHDPLMLQMHCLRDPFKDKRVRQAVSYAMPYQEIKDNIWKAAARSYKSPFVDECLGYTEEYFPYSTDLQKARALMEEAGVSDGFDTTMVIPGELLAEIEPTGKAIKEALAKIGINVTLVDLNEMDFRKVSFSHDFDLMLDPHTHQVADAYYISLDDYGDEKWGIENMNQYYSQEVFRIQAESLTDMTEAERVKHVHELQKVILEDAPQAYLLQINSLMGARKNIKGLEWDANGRLFYQRVYKIDE